MRDNGLRGKCMAKVKKRMLMARFTKENGFKVNCSQWVHLKKRKTVDLNRNFSYHVLNQRDRVD